MQQDLLLSNSKLTLVVPRSVDAVLDMYLARDQGDRDPYWCRPWPSAIALAQLILQNPDLVRGKRVCDIGCGLGLAGIAAALSGAKEVVMLDREPVALQCSLLSAQACGLQSVQDYTQHGQSEATPGHQHQQPSDWKGASVLPEGSNSHAAQSAKAGLLQVHAELFDWSSPSSQASYDVALACDVLYEPYSVEPIANITPQLLNSQTGQLLLADPSHRTKHNRDRFLQILAGQSRAPMLLREASEVTVRMDEQDTQVQLQLLCMKQGQETVGIKFNAGV